LVKFKNLREEIKSNSSDTLNLSIGKNLSWKVIKMQAIIDGNDSISSIKIQNIFYQSPKKRISLPEEKLKNKIDRKINRKFYNKIK